MCRSWSKRRSIIRAGGVSLVLVCAIANFPSANGQHRAGHDWWSLQPVRPVAVPQADGTKWTINPIDYFILHRLQKEGLVPSPAADRRTLIRRLSFDLVGLPPDPYEVDAF